MRGKISASMPRTPRGQKRPADVISNAVLVMKIATGETEEVASRRPQSAGGRVGGAARAKALTPEQRQDVARTAAQARWKRR